MGRGYNKYVRAAWLDTYTIIHRKCVLIAFGGLRGVLPTAVMHFSTKQLSKLGYGFNSYPYFFCINYSAQG